ncbi:MAG: hypothetical protein A2277_15200 [Desulfobacterales bacterium RIFOXYA12_FULL_46_15]|nr:MAG: hypothetical protein A2277_15200 [Desulfobacterales bacterium RIFOXYA12_FULL_46_15]
MKQMKQNSGGFTLIEIMVTLLVLSIGVSAMAVMQVRAIKSNQNAFSRSDANFIAISFLEEFKRLPFDDAGLTAGNNLDAGKAPAGGNPNPAAADNQFNAAGFPALANLFQIDGTTIIDGAGRRYTLFWNVDKTPVNFGGVTYTPFCTIRLFVYWNTLLGPNSISITTIKFNNLEA